MPASVITWTRVTDPDIAVTLMPPWFAGHMLSGHGRYGFLLTTGDVLRVSRLMAVHVSSVGAVMLDVLLDNAGVPIDVDQAWRTKHFLGAPVPGAVFASVNVASVVAAVEFAAAEFAENKDERSITLPDALAPPDGVVELVAVGRD
jgi:hypothetical protein